MSEAREDSVGTAVCEVIVYRSPYVGGAGGKAVYAGRSRHVQGTPHQEVSNHGCTVGPKLDE